MIQPDYIFETSWEVCNRVGGIYAVLSTRAASMQREHPDRVFFFGPDFGEHSDLYFREDKKLLKKWTKDLRIFESSNHQIFESSNLQIPIRVGRWTVPGEPIAILLKADAMWERKNQIFAWAWEKAGVMSHAAYGDYNESCLFGYACGMVMESLYRYLITQNTPNNQNIPNLPKVCMHANEWQTAFTIFYMREHCPEVGTLFTTHATGIGRSIAGNGKPLYDYFEGYHGDQMAEELNMVSKHSVEKQAAHWADCFTTVSEITARECKQLLDKPVDIITPNGFEPDFVPTGEAFDRKRAEAREALLRVAGQQLGGVVPPDAMLLCIAGRLEMKNKGIDAFLRAMERLGEKMYHRDVHREVIAFVMIPYLDKPVMRFGRVSVVFVPYYLNGDDPLFRKTYYDLLIGMDATVFPSYYEPWGYTPLESVAFHVPTITTDLAGFGAWVDTGVVGLEKGVVVIPRTDSNYLYVIDQIAESLIQMMEYTPAQISRARRAAAAIAKRAEWSKFFKYYRKAYEIALKKAARRMEDLKN
ncbi:MAG: glycosyltransferase [Paludibacteraceae bacterium]|nr:glycosyltransferase [Paludibacteraceae bacterium]